MGIALRWLKNWISALKDRRESERMSLPVVAFYWNGATPHAYQVKSVSQVGAYIVTGDRWYVGTVLQLTLHYGDGSVQSSPCQVVRAKVVRLCPDGFGVHFIYLNHVERRSFKTFLAAAQKLESFRERQAEYPTARYADDKNPIRAE